jgi:hypothetical protein
LSCFKLNERDNRRDQDRQNVNVAAAFSQFKDCNFFQIKLTIGIMYTNLTRTKDILRLI